LDRGRGQNRGGQRGGRGRGNQGTLTCKITI
jgi:hypothetical protein